MDSPFNVDSFQGFGLRCLAYGVAWRVLILGVIGILAPAAGEPARLHRGSLSQGLVAADPDRLLVGVQLGFIGLLRGCTIGCCGGEDHSV